jgi:hypothetical protein
VAQTVVSLSNVLKELYCDTICVTQQRGFGWLDLDTVQETNARPDHNRVLQYIVEPGLFSTRYGLFLLLPPLGGSRLDSIGYFALEGKDLLPASVSSVRSKLNNSALLTEIS